jgi:methylated-DNA-[protein]-cysteine S-methyltransferase
MSLYPPLLQDHIDTPIGDMILIARDGVLLLLEFEEATDRVEREMKARFKDVETYELTPAKNPFGFSDKIRAYYAGELGIIDDIQADGGGTAFEKTVWAELRRIPKGETISYGRLAKRIGKPDAMRAVGLANGKNPIAVVVPCHRVIGADGSLTGYGGGLHRKEWLLRHEGALLV